MCMLFTGLAMLIWTVFSCSARRFCGQAACSMIWARSPNCVLSNNCRRRLHAHVVKILTWRATSGVGGVLGMSVPHVPTLAHTRLKGLDQRCSLDGLRSGVVQKCFSCSKMQIELLKVQLAVGQGPA